MRIFIINKNQNNILGVFNTLDDAIKIINKDIFENLNYDKLNPNKRYYKNAVYYVNTKTGFSDKWIRNTICEYYKIFLYEKNENEWILVEQLYINFDKLVKDNLNTNKLQYSEIIEYLDNLKLNIDLFRECINNKSELFDYNNYWKNGENEELFINWIKFYKLEDAKYDVYGEFVDMNNI